MYAPVAVEGQLSFHAQPDDIGVVPGGSLRASLFMLPRVALIAGCAGPGL